MSLRPYQADLDRRRRASAARRVCVQLPTGGGKSHLIREAAAGKALLLAHAEWLVDQIHALVGGHVLKAGMPAPTGWPIVGMVQTVARRELVEVPEIVIPDESHHAVAGQWREILGRYPEARVCGFTATPQRLDGIGLGGVFDELICGPSYGELIEGGWLKPFELYSIPSGIDLSDVKSRAGDFAREDVKLAVRRSTIFGDVIEHYLLHCRDLGGHASFWPSIETAEHAAERFTSRGVRCLPLHSKLPRAEIAARVAGLRTGSVETLATVDMIGEGLDVPGLSSVSCCRPTQSLTVALQQWGRCNRGGGGVARIMDHVGNWTRHGLPDDDREWTLEGHVKRRIAPGTLPVWDCPTCWTVNRSTCTACRRCGTPKPRALVEAEERAAELELITRAGLDDIHGLCATPEQYVAFARSKGKRATWAAYQFAIRDKRAGDGNPFLAAAGEVRPTRAEFLDAARACGVHSVAARESAKMRGLRW